MLAIRRIDWELYIGKHDPHDWVAVEDRILVAVMRVTRSVLISCKIEY